MNVEILFAREYFFFLLLLPPFSLRPYLLFSGRHGTVTVPFAKGFSMKEYQHYHGDTLISEVPHSWRNTSIKVSEPPPLKPSCLLQNALSPRASAALLSTMQPAWFCFWPRKIFSPDTHPSRSLALPNLLSYLSCIPYSPAYIFLAKKKKEKKKGKRRGEFRNATLKQFPLNFRCDLGVWKKYSIFETRSTNLEVWLRYCDYQTYFSKKRRAKTRGESFINRGRVYSTKRITHQSNLHFIFYNNYSFV